jgi:adenosylhomocysteinase
MPMIEAAPIGDVFVTSTGDINVIDRHHFEAMKDGAIVCNSGHFNVELNLDALREMATQEPRMLRPFVKEYRLPDGRRINVLADGRLVNLGAAEGHPSGVMDMSFANQALSAEYLLGHSEELEHEVYAVPDEIDERIAMLKLRAMNVEIDVLTEEQRKYLNSWRAGT